MKRGTSIDGGKTAYTESLDQSSLKKPAHEENTYDFSAINEKHVNKYMVNMKSHVETRATTMVFEKQGIDLSSGI